MQPRAYYAMFHVAEAFLENEGMSFSKHASVIAAFGRYAARAGKVPVELHRYLLDAQKVRLKGDYGPRRAVTAEQAEEQIGWAEEFLEEAQRHFGPLPPSAEAPQEDNQG